MAKEFALFRDPMFSRFQGHHEETIEVIALPRHTAGVDRSSPRTGTVGGATHRNSPQ